jgi:putative flippase GtrA
LVEERDAVDARTSVSDLAPAVELSLATRLHAGVRRPQNWLQLVRFAVVGGSGYIVNLCVFAACVHLFSIDYRISAVIAFVVAVCNNFWLNRHWTFGAKDHHAGVQAVRFFAVYVLTSAVAYAVLIALVDGAGLPKVLSQAIANGAVAPLSFVAQKMWCFRA